MSCRVIGLGEPSVVCRPIRLTGLVHDVRDLPVNISGPMVSLGSMSERTLTLSRTR